mmetsp:Transcript_60952/g.132375  ORF Transcript_60952/g.132375 Transcript_60952/m.132375 type:complete len:251 (-) Transcript_60952:450-1202(-)
MMSEAVQRHKPERRHSPSPLADVGNIHSKRERSLSQRRCGCLVDDRIRPLHGETSVRETMAKGKQNLSLKPHVGNPMVGGEVCLSNVSRDKVGTIHCVGQPATGVGVAKQSVDNGRSPKLPWIEGIENGGGMAHGAVNGEGTSMDQNNDSVFLHFHNFLKQLLLNAREFEVVPVKVLSLARLVETDENHGHVRLCGHPFCVWNHRSVLVVTRGAGQVGEARVLAVRVVTDTTAEGVRNMETTRFSDRGSY